MATVLYKGIEYKLVCVDPSVNISDGDGLTPATALRDLPDSLENNTCYLFRRLSDNEVKVKHQVDTSLVNIMFLGMPKADDPKWIQELITDEDINGAWKADDAQYANVCFWHRTDSTDTNSEKRACICANNLEHATFINCYLYRYTADISGSYYEYTSPFFTDGNNQLLKLKFGLYGCKLGVKGVDLDNDTYLADTKLNEIDGSANKEYYSVWARKYFVFKNVYCAEIDNCVINNIVRNYQGSSAHGDNYKFQGGQALWFSNVARFKFTNSTVNALFYNQKSVSGYEESIYVQDNNKADYKCFITVDNIKYNAISDGYGFADMCLIETYASHLSSAVISVSNITIEPKRMASINVIKELNYPQCGIYIYGRYSYRQLYINNIKMDGTTSPLKVSVARPLSLTIMGQTAGIPHTGEIKNINIKLAENEIFKDAAKSVCDFNFNYGTMDNSSNSFCAAPFSSYQNRYNVQDYPIVENINIDAPCGFLYLNRVVANFKQLRCGLILDYANSIDVEKLTFDVMNLQGIQINNRGNYLRIREYVGNPEVQNVLQLRQNVDSCSVYVDKANTNLFNTTVNTTDVTSYTGYLYSTLCCLNMKEIGRFFARNGNTFAQSWSNKREGSSSNASLKLNCNTNLNWPLMIGAEPYKGFAIKPTTSGKKYLRAYFAIKDFESDAVEFGQRQFVLTVRVPQVDENNNVTYKTYYSMPDDWQEDTSTWSEEIDGAYCMDIPLEVSTTKYPLDVKLTYNWYHSTGITFFDPDMKLIDN